MTSDHTDSTEVPPQPLRSFPWQVRVILAVLFVLGEQAAAFARRIAGASGQFQRLWVSAIVAGLASC